jgi:hypothetical protein
MYGLDACSVLTIRYASRRACSREHTFTALKEIDKLLALIGSVWEGGNIGREGV